MTILDFQTFERQALAEGFDEVLDRTWPPDAIVESHTHPFSVKARVVRGEMWLTIGSDTRHLQPGDEFTLARDEPHAELYGSAGASYWVARRN
ncbi:MAG: AraC family ligand binding domain-containing protein [Betaproteobacteria bacterium]|nr:AraC family ligand binding domain-containing protein [Betaproteobacteria bacterium]